MTAKLKAISNRLHKILACIIVFVAAAHAADPQGKRLIYREDPEYPVIAAQMNLHGNVRLKIWIASDGKVRRTEYVGGHPLLAESALKAIKNWKYEPATKESTVEIVLKF